MSFTETNLTEKTTSLEPGLPYYKLHDRVTWGYPVLQVHIWMMYKWVVDRMMPLDMDIKHSSWVFVVGGPGGGRCGNLPNSCEIHTTFCA